MSYVTAGGTCVACPSLIVPLGTGGGGGGGSGQFLLLANGVDFVLKTDGSSFITLVRQSFILLVDAVSFLLQSDGSSKIERV